MKKVDLTGKGPNLARTERIISEDQVIELICENRAAIQELVSLMNDMSEILNAINDSVKEGTNKAAEGIEAAKETKDAILKVKEAIERDIQSRGGNVNKENRS